MGEVVQLDIFTVNTVDPPWRDNRDAMEYPFLSLQKVRTKMRPLRRVDGAPARAAAHCAGRDPKAASLFGCCDGSGV